VGQEVAVIVEARGANARARWIARGDFYASTRRLAVGNRISAFDVRSNRETAGGAGAAEVDDGALLVGGAQCLRRRCDVIVLGHERSSAAREHGENREPERDGERCA